MRASAYLAEIAQRTNIVRSLEVPARKQRFGLLARMAGTRCDVGRGRGRALGMVGAGGGDVDGARFAEAVELIGEIIDAPGDEMRDDAFALELAVNVQQPSCNDGAAEAFVDFRPDDDIGDAGFVLDGQENDARGGAGALAGDDEARHPDHPAVRQ